MSSPSKVDDAVATEAVTERRIMVGVLVVIVAALWIRPMFSSLWLDELGSWWVVKDGFDDVLSRAFEYHGQSPLYYAVAWLAAQVSRSEVVLRLPSFVAGLVAAWLVHRLTGRLIDAKAALPSVVAFCGFGMAAFGFSEMRPYGLALMLLVGSALATVRWLDDGRFWGAVAAVVLAASVVWCHYIFALPIVAQAAYAVSRIRRREAAVGFAALGLAALGFAALVIPLASQIISLWGRRAGLSIPAEATVAGFVQTVAYPVAAGALILGGLLALAQGKVWIDQRPGRPGSLLLIAAWLLLPPGVLFIATATMDIDLLSPRYFVSIAPAFAMAFGWAWSSLEPSMARRSVALVFAILAVGSFGSALKAGEDWRGATEFVRGRATEDSTILLHPALIESTQIEWFEDPERRSYLLSPIAYYPMTSVTAPLPFRLDTAAQDYLESTILPAVKDLEEFFVVTRYPSVPFRAWLDGRLGDAGWRSEVSGEFGTIEVIRFSRSAGEPSA